MVIYLINFRFLKWKIKKEKYLLFGRLFVFIFLEGLIFISIFEFNIARSKFFEKVFDDEKRLIV